MPVKIITVEFDVFLFSQKAFLILLSEYYNLQCNPKRLLSGFSVDHFKQSCWNLFLVSVENHAR